MREWKSGFRVRHRTYSQFKPTALYIVSGIRGNLTFDNDGNVVSNIGLFHVKDTEGDGMGKYDP